MGASDDESQPSVAELTADGYVRDAASQFYVSKVDGANADQVAVYRWWSGAHGDWVDIPDGEDTDADRD